MLAWITLIILVAGLLVGTAFILTRPSKGKQRPITLVEPHHRSLMTNRHHVVPGEVVAVAPNGQYAFRVDDGTYQIGTIGSNDMRTVSSKRIPHTAGESELATVRSYRLPNDDESYASYSSDGMTRYVMPCKNYTMFTRVLRSEDDGAWYGLHSNLVWIRLEDVPSDSVEVHLDESLANGIAVNANDVVSVLHRGVWTADLRIHGLQSVDAHLVVLDKSRRVFRVTAANGLESRCRLIKIPADASILSNGDMEAIVSSNGYCKLFHLRDGSETRDLLPGKDETLSVAWNTNDNVVFLGQPGRVVELSVD